MTAPDCGDFMGWSFSMYFEPPDRQDYRSRTYIIAPEADKRERPNFFRQNVTYWATFDRWKLPDPEITIDGAIDVYFVPDKSMNERIDAPYLGFDLDIAPMLDIFYERPDFIARIPLTMPSMFFTTEEDEGYAYFTVLNNGKTSYSFGGWYLESNPDKIYRDGETVHLGPLIKDGAKELIFHPLWI